MYPIYPLIVCLLLASAAHASLDMVPGATWTAAGTNKHIQAHGAGIIQVDGTYYMIGENHTNGAYFQSINCYSSTNLFDWTFENEVLTLQSSGDLGPERVVERPKVLYNSETETYVMWMHIDNVAYTDAKAGVATSATVCGDYTYLNSSQPLGHLSRDLGLFQDTDGTAYLLSEDRSNGLRIDRLSSDYLTAESSIYIFDDYEAPAMIKINDTYFLFASGLTGYSANDNYYTTATNLSGPWADWALFAPEGTNTFTSQTTYVLNVNGDYMYAALSIREKETGGADFNCQIYGRSLVVDRPRFIDIHLATTNHFGELRIHRKPSPALTVSWMLHLLIGVLSFSQAKNATWTPSFASGTWSWTTITTNVSATSGTRGGSATLSGDLVSYIGGPDAGTLTFDSLSFSSAPGETTVQIVYRNDDNMQRACNVTVNGESHILSFLPTSGSADLAISVLDVTLETENNNTIIFSAYNEGYCPNIEGLMIS
ncbi:hypothetical protein AbraIFM66950_009614 [Aspergillus brasiliensis]|nr:hypothetical protein AbraIFM66950_009614 [Aspergillus brasiliensis]